MRRLAPLKIKRRSSSSVVALMAVIVLAIQSIWAFNLPMVFAQSQPSDVWISAALPDPEEEDIHGEYIILENQTALPIDISGWSIDDGAAPGVLSGSISANGSYKICKDANPATSSAVNCDEEWKGMSLKNTEDIITLKDGSTVIDRVSYKLGSGNDEVLFLNHISAPDVTAPRASDVVVSSLDVNNVISGTVTITFTLEDASDINLQKGKSHVRLMSGLNESGVALSSPQYLVSPVLGEQDRYQGTIPTTDFVPFGKEANGFHVYIRSQDTAGNATAASFYEGASTIDVDNKAPEIKDIVVKSPVSGTVYVDVTLNESHAINEDNRFTFAKFLTGKELVGSALASSSKYGLVHLSENTYRAVVDTKDFSPDGSSGHYLLYLSAQDVYGNKSWDNTTRGIVIDNNPPSSPTITTPTERQWFKTTPIVNQWSAVSDESGIDYYQIAYSYDDGHSFGGSTCSEVTISGVSGFIGCRNVDSTQRNHTPSPSEQGGVTIWVRAVDNAGNIGPWSKSVHYNFDSVSPTVTISAPEGLTDGTFNVSGQASDNLELNRIYVQLVNRNDNKRYGGTTINLIGEGQNADWSHSYNASANGLPDGTYAAHVSVTDMAGNTSSAGWTDDFVVDNTDPVVSITAPSDDDVVNGTVTISGTVSDDNPGHYYLVIKDVNGAIVGGPKTVNQADVDDYEWDTTAIDDGEYTIFLAARDAAGNKDGDANNAGVSVQSIKVTVDNTAPVVTFTLPAKGTIYAPGDVRVYGTVDTSAVGTVAVTLNSVTQNVDFDQDGNWTASFAGTTPGQYTIVATAQDAFGNIATATVEDIIVRSVPASFIVTPQLPAVANEAAQNQAANPQNAVVPANGAVAATATATAQGETDAEVLADETVAATDSDVKAAETVSEDTTVEDAPASRSFSGIANYWWLIVLTILVGAVVLTLVRWRRSW